MKNILFLSLVLLLAIPAGVMADPGNSYPGMMWQNSSGSNHGPGMMGHWQNGTGPGSYWQNGSGPYYGPGMMGYGQNNPGLYSGCPGVGMMNGWGNGGIVFPLMGLMAVLVIIFTIVWTIAGVLLIIWLYKKIQTK